LDLIANLFHFNMYERTLYSVSKKYRFGRRETARSGANQQMKESIIRC
jgi:hypothetical protein